MDYNVIAEAIYKACAETGFKAEFSRNKYEVDVNFGVGENFWSVGVGISGFRSGLARIYKKDKLEEIEFDEALRLIKEGFAKVGVVLEVPNETAA